MPLQSSIKPRKMPRQARAQATVEAILDATAHILVAGGHAGVNTNRVAEAAGVSIGSLYQYFPGKEALLTALRRRHADQMRRMLLEYAGSAVQLPVAEAVRLLVHAIMQAHLIDPRLHRALEEVMPRPDLVDGREDFDRDLRAMVTTVLTAYRNDILPADLELAGVVLMRTVDTLVHAALIDDTPGVTAVAMEEEIVTLVLRYLLGAGAAPALVRRAD